MAESLAFLLEFSSARAGDEARATGKALADLDASLGKVSDAAKQAGKPLNDLEAVMGRVAGASDKLGASMERQASAGGLTLQQHRKIAESFAQLFQNVRESSLSMEEHSKIAQSLGNFFGGLGKAAEGTGKKTATLGDALGGAKKWLDGLSFSGIAVGAGAVYGLASAVGFVKDVWVGVIEVISWGIEKAAEWGSTIVDSASKAERIRVGLDVSLGARGGAQAAGYIRQVSRGGIGSFTEQQLAPAVQRLAQAGFKDQSLARALTAATDVEAGQGGGVGTIERVVQLLRKTKLSAKLEAEALTELGIDTSELFKALGKSKGISEKAARQLAAQSGGFQSDTLINAVERAIAGPGGTLGDKTLKAAGTVESKLAQLKALPDRYFRAVANTAGYGKLSNALGQILDKFDPDSANGKRIIKALGRISDAVAAMFSGVDGSLFDDLADGVVIFLGGVREALPYVKVFFTMLWDIGKVIASIAGAIPSFVGQLTGLSSAFGKFGAKPDANSFVGQFFGFGGLGGTGQGKQLTDGFKAGAAGEATGEELGGGIHKGTRKELKVQSPSRVFAEIGRQSAAGFSAGFEDEIEAPAVPRAGGVLAGAPAAPRAGGNVSISVPFALEIHTTGSADQIVEVVEQRLLPRIETELAAAIHGLGVEMGVG